MENINSSKPLDNNTVKLSVASRGDTSPASINASEQESMIGTFSGEAGSSPQQPLAPQLPMNQRDVDRT